MNTLKEHLYPVALEYARQTALLLGTNPADFYFVGMRDLSPVGLCDFGDTLFLTLEEMQTIIDRLDEWTARYGSREAVAQEVRDWLDWCTDARDARAEYHLTTDHAVHYAYPRINLATWLSGLKEIPEPAATIEVLRTQAATLADIITRYGENRSLGNVLQNLQARISTLEKQQKEKRNQIQVS